MNIKYRFLAPVALFALAPIFTAGCGSDGPLGAAGDLCCTEFKVGADLSGVDFGVDASIAGQFTVLAQAASDFGVTANAMVDDVTAACLGIAQDLGASQTDLDGAEAKPAGAERAKAYCTLAVASLKAAGVVEGSLNIEPPQFKCEASIDAKANCQAKCDVSGQCDIKANPPKCSGGKPPTVSCSGGCKAEVDGGSFSCKGKCSATVSGSCTAQGGVECQGKCEGTCKGSAEGGTGTGVKADGTCDGTCEGTCSVTKPGVACNGSFEGECKGSCEATGPSASVECNATCTGEPGTPIKCEGGKIEGGCQVDAKCDANCDASVQAKASCDVKPFSITANGSASANIEAAIATLKVNLPKLVLAVKARGEAIGEIAGSFTGSLDVIANPGDLGIKGTACLGAIVPVLATAGANAKGSIEAGLSVTGAVGLN